MKHCGRCGGDLFVELVETEKGLVPGLSCLQCGAEYALRRNPCLCRPQRTIKTKIKVGIK